MKKILLLSAFTAVLAIIGIAFPHSKVSANGAYAFSSGWAYPAGCPGNSLGLQTGFVASVSANQNKTLPYGTTSYSATMRLDTGICPLAAYGTVDNARFQWLFGGNPNISPYGMPTANFGTIGHGLYSAFWGVTINTSANATSPGWHEAGLIYQGCADYPFVACTTDTGPWSEIDFQYYIQPLPPPSPPSTPSVIINCTTGSPGTATISWSGNPGSWFFGTGYIVDFSKNSSFSGYWNRFIASPSTSTIVPDGSNWAAQAPASGTLTLTRGSTYWTRVYNGATSTVKSFLYDCPASPSNCSAGIAGVVGNVIAPGQQFKISFAFDITGGNPATSYNWNITADKEPAPPAMWVDGTKNPFVSGSSLPGHLPAPGNTITNPSFMSTNTPGSYTFNFTIDVTGVGNGRCSASITVIVTNLNRPYLRVYGGDVLTGGGFGSCTPTANSGIIGYNTGSPDFGGAGGQFATQATGAIYQFASAAQRIGGSPGPGNGLSFANTGGGVDATWGGSFGTAVCSADYNGAAAVNDPGGNTIGGYTVLPGSNNRYVIKRVGSDVVISNNIQYQSSGWTSTSVPSFYLVVIGGNIYIDKAVTNLDGIYIAQPSGGNGGTIYTCASGTTPISAVNLSTNCGSKLIVNGAFLANQVRFLRANGTLASAPVGNAGPELSTSANIAEVFNYNPELWMADGPIPSSGTKYDSITSLPPVL